ncbi:phosphate acyltransferase, partial [Escherichia coli]|uniref:phosphate acyltransferase n=1 Tax=Escherichia coli TaxID=562 RepID=UPI00207D66E2
MTQKINSIARDEFACRTVSDVVSTDREAVMQSILKGVQEYGKSVGMDIIDVRLKRYGLRIKPNVDFGLINPEEDPRYRHYVDLLIELGGRRGVTPEAARTMVRTDNT